jgi:RNA polymerase sigma-70 factor (ECF subfamily)
MNLEGRTSVLSEGGGGFGESVTQDDIALVRRCQKGDALAFEQLVIKYRSKVFSMIYGMVQNEQDAWDLAQEGFIKAWRSIHRFKGQASFYTWLYRIVTNVAIDSLRRKGFKKTAEFDDQIAANEVAPGSKTVPTPDPMKEIEELQYNEIAQALGCSIGTVMSRLFYARKKLQTLLKDVYENL